MTDRHAHDPAPEGWRAQDAFPDADYAHLHGWDRDFEAYSDFDLPVYVGPSTFSKLPWSPTRRRSGAEAWTWPSWGHPSTTP